MEFRRILASSILVSSIATGVVWAAEADFDFVRCSLLEDHSYDGHSSRVVSDAADGIPFLVLLPADYESATTTRYPVVYLLQGGANDVDCFLGKTDLIDFTATRPTDRHAIVVMPDVFSGPPFFPPDKRPALEAAFTDSLIPYVDDRYRTLADRSHRSIAGFSAGGTGALYLAGRHPDLFGAVGSLSGGAEVRPPRPDDPNPTATAAELAADAYWTSQGRPGVFTTLGNPVTNELGWRVVNPVDMAPNYHGMAVDLFSGNGQPCDAQDVGLPVAIFWPPGAGATAEMGIHPMTEHLSAALAAEHVPHRFTEGCGIHTYRYVQREIHAWWEPMFQAFGRPDPISFDHRRADPSFDVWGWSFTADPTRAPEFLTVTGAAPAGIRLTGSGTETVITDGYFLPGEVVTLSGAVEPNAVASSDGRISFHVDLGPAHEFQQYTVQQRALESAGNYFVTKSVTFQPEG